MSGDQTKPIIDLDAHGYKAAEQYEHLRPLYVGFAETLRRIFTDSTDAKRLKVASVDSRAKDVASFARKAALPSQEDPAQPKYANPLRDVTDLAGVRIITFFPKDIAAVDEIVREQFEVCERSDKGELLRQNDRFGYQSVHYLVMLRPSRAALPEYSRFDRLIAEVQVRTALRHAWAEIEHDIQYRSVETIPTAIRRRFMSLAGLLEIADREFQAIQDDDEELRRAARTSVQQGRLEHVEITADALKAYLDRKLGPDGRVASWSYDFTARFLRRLGFADFRQVDECISPYSDDAVSRAAYGTRQGQLRRFELLLLAGMGEEYLNRNPWNSAWVVENDRHYMDKMIEAGIEISRYVPPSPGNSGN